MTTHTSQPSDQDKISTLIKNRTDAIKSQNIKAVFSNYSDELLMFDVVDELAVTGVQAAEERLKKWFDTIQKLVDYETRIIQITVDDHMAFCNNFNRIVAITKDRKDLDMWWRETLGLQKENGEWFIFSAHSSVPFEGQSGKASTGLKPLVDLRTESNNGNSNLANLSTSIFHAYETKDRSACEKILAGDFTFTSPNNDDHISKDAYFERCWPFSERNPVYEFEKIVVDGNDTVVVYTCKTKTGKKFKNIELFKFEKDKIKAIEVFFGNTI